MMVLTSKQRKILEKQAHDLSPVVIIGQHGVTENLLKMVEDSLKAHELIKVKFNEYKDDKREYSEDIANRTDSNLVRVIGNVAIFYRQNEDPEKRLISLK
ncbi:ribosome assembly RNA-binding protein YhbY [Treponema sp.]|uniref:ribosome assembly RNA-binding protein YhbY n=1 Tax=Treponema sp. TaxID=166 RepID=UPI00298D988A|nr:ribosome assembly RNA-binding protein YhbY [Treponema sp.]MCI6442483.1 ribosome assembly RNA-binding protein YhbY [Spirochaetia bacterium]MDY4132022.1 ribosome assembly RNA-binding protein YhbY [Treponema sp.]